MPDFFNQQMAESYDEKNSRLSAFSANMHMLIRLILADLPSNARVLCAGAGTGAEILALAKDFPGWSFVGVDPSEAMLKVCRDKLAAADLLDRCELVHGYIDDVRDEAKFDAALSIMVAHFIAREDRSAYYQAVHDRLKPGGCFISTEISSDLDAVQFPSLLKNWERVHSMMGANPQSLQSLPDTLRNTLSIVSQDETESMLKRAGFELPVAFLQAFLIRGWYATR
ncbi:class I SAM-dependent methyltransferase [Labrenzia sp. 011]|uniref:SAM-dependent methyltransferase n=1 Tax=Labrenzia sp. 011 TaxID=2171494 RepID=UPI00197B9C65|nr:class I SAM-dependent methyltransferase [Labrenzia sp. 011]